MAGGSGGWGQRRSDKEKGFLYNSPYEGVYFVNIRYMFNGDRLAFVKAYHLKGAKPPSTQLSLGLDKDAE